MEFQWVDEGMGGGLEYVLLILLLFIHVSCECDPNWKYTNNSFFHHIVLLFRSRRTRSSTLSLWADQ